MAPAGPSEHWTEFDSATAPPKVARVIENGNWKYLCAKAVRTHPAQVGGLTCTANLARFANGQFNVVVELSFSDGSYWVARIMLPSNDSGVQRKNTPLEMGILSGITTMRLVTQRTSIPVPVVFAYDTNPRNAFGFRYVLMSPLPGKKMPGHLAITIPDASRTKVATQMATYVNELSQITLPQLGQIWMDPKLSDPPEIIGWGLPKQQRGPFNSSSAYFADQLQRQKKTIEALHDKDDDWQDWVIYCKIWASALPFLNRPELRRGPFPLHHHDFHYNNILFDENFNITGVIDWDGTGTVPWEKASVFLDITPYQLFEPDYNAKILLFRKAFVDHYKQVESPIPGGRGVLLSEILESPLPHIVNAFSRQPPPSGKFASKRSLDLLQLLFGPETTLDNYKVRQKRQRGKPIPKVAIWGMERPVRQVSPAAEQPGRRVSKRVNKGVRKR